MNRTGGYRMNRDELTHALRVLWFTITGATLVVCGLFLVGRLSSEVLNFDLVPLLAVSSVGAIAAWLQYKR